MTEYYRFFGSTPEDPRQYDQTEFAEVLERFFRNGYFPGVDNELEVTPTDPARLAVSVSTGQGWINGYWYGNDEPKEIELETANATNDRIDRIVLRLDTVNARNIIATVKTGTPASNPSAPGLTRNEQVYELSLATVWIASGATSIGASSITDTRDNESVCGQAVPWNVPTDTDLLEHTESRNNPHNVTKAQVGLSNVTNDRQATKTEFDAHTGDNTRHITSQERSNWNAKETPQGAQQKINQATANMAETNITNTFSQDQIIDKSMPNWIVRARHTTGSVAGVQMRDADNNSKWTAGYSPSSGAYNIYDYEAGRARVLIYPNSHMEIRDLVNFLGSVEISGTLRSSNLPADRRQMLYANSEQIWVGNPDTRLRLESNQDVQVYIPGTGVVTLIHTANSNLLDGLFLNQTSNLSDLANVSTARSNLGLTGNSNTTHYHDGRYYTKAEINTKHDELFQLGSDGKTVIRDAIAAAGGTPPSGSPDQYTHQDLANAVSTVSKYAGGSTPAQTTVQIRGINFSPDILYASYNTSDDGIVTFLWNSIAGGYIDLIKKPSTLAADPVVTQVSGGFNITIDRPGSTGFDWEVWGGRP